MRQTESALVTVTSTLRGMVSWHTTQDDVEKRLLT